MSIESFHYRKVGLQTNNFAFKLFQTGAALGDGQHAIIRPVEHGGLDGRTFRQISLHDSGL